MNHLIKDLNIENKVIFHDYKGIAYYTLQAKSLGLHFFDIDLVVNAHGNTRLSNQFNRRYPQHTTDLIGYYMEQKTIELADIVIAPSQYYLDWYCSQGYQIKKQKVIQNLLKINSNIVKLNNVTNDGAFNICFFARVEPLKGIFNFLDAIDEVLEKTDFKHIK